MLLRSFETLVAVRVEAVEEADFAVVPLSVGVEVMQSKEGGGVEVVDVVFFYRGVSIKEY